MGPAPPPDPPTTAASLLPSDEDAIEYQPKDGALVWVHVQPPFTLVYMPPLAATAASLLPSDDDAIDRQSADKGRPFVTRVHDTPAFQLL